MSGKENYSDSEDKMVFANSENVLDHHDKSDLTFPIISVSQSEGLLYLHDSHCPYAIDLTVGGRAFRLLNNSIITNHCTDFRPHAPVSYFVLFKT